MLFLVTLRYQKKAAILKSIMKTAILNSRAVMAAILNLRDGRWTWMLRLVGAMADIVHKVHYFLSIAIVRIRSSTNLLQVTGVFCHLICNVYHIFI